MNKRDADLLDRTLDYLAVAHIIEPYKNSYKVTDINRDELVDLLPTATKHRLSFEFTCLLASVKHSVTHQRLMRLLIRLAVLGGWADNFLSGLDQVPFVEGINVMS